MPFRSQWLNAEHYEVVMEPNTMGIGGIKRGLERRMALCTHENDADVIAEALNQYEKLSKLA